MRWAKVKPVVAFLFPGGLLAVAAWGFLRPGGLPQWIQPLVDWLPVLVLLFGLVLAWRVKSPRTGLAFLLLMAADRALWASAGMAGFGGEAAVSATIISHSVAVLLPLNFLGLALLGERDVLSREMIAPVGLLAIQAMGLIWLSQPAQHALALEFMTPVIDPGWTAWTAVPQTALVAFVIAWGLLALRFGLRQDPTDSGAAWGLVTIFLALHGISLGWAPTNFFAATGAILVAGMVAESYRSALYDPKTGVAGRVLFDQLAGRLQGRYAVAVVQIDELARMSRRHGPALQDDLMGRIAAVMPSAPEGAQVFRYSPETFAIVFPGSLTKQALAPLEAARQRVQQAKLAVGKGGRVGTARTEPSGATASRASITVSIGVAEQNDKLRTVEQVVRAAHKAVFIAKQAGGNQVQQLHAPGDLALQALLARRRPVAVDEREGAWS